MVRPKNTAADTLRARIWAWSLKTQSGRSFEALEKQFRDEAGNLDLGYTTPFVSKTNYFRKVSEGRFYPSYDRIEFFEAKYPGSSLLLHHPLIEMADSVSTISDINNLQGCSKSAIDLIRDGAQNISSNRGEHVDFSVFLKEILKLNSNMDVLICCYAFAWLFYFARRHSAHSDAWAETVKRAMKIFNEDPVFSLFPNEAYELLSTPPDAWASS